MTEEDRDNLQRRKEALLKIAIDKIMLIECLTKQLEEDCHAARSHAG